MAPFASPLRARKTRLSVPALKSLKWSPLRSLNVKSRNRDLIQEDWRNRFEDSDDEHSPLFHWDDEKTLVADLMHVHTASEEKQDEQLSSLIDSIQPAFTSLNQDLLSDMANTLVPIVHRVKLAHQALNDSVDPEYSLGVDEVNTAGQEMEALAVKQHDETRSAYIESQERLRRLFAQLKDAFAERDRLWDDLEHFLNDNFEPVNRMFHALPDEMDRLVTGCQKQSKQLSVDKGGAEKMLKEVLAKFS